MYSKIRQVLYQAIYESGDVLLRYFGKVKNVEFKSTEFDIVTEADKESEKCIVNVIRSNFPLHQILAEEKVSDTTTGSEFKWIIDPLDGTTNFFHGVPIFSVSIAVEQQGKVIMGAVYHPTARELFFAERGEGAWLNDKPISVSQISEINKSLLVTGFPYDRSEIDRLIPYVREILIRAHGLLRLGSAAIDLCYVACGRLEGFWEFFLNPWDTAAGYLIVEEAGGKVTDFAGNPYSPYCKQILATNGRIHNELLSILKQ